MSDMKVIRLGDDFVASPSDDTQYSSRYTDGEKFILCVGTLEIRKNQVALLHAYRILDKRYPGLLPKLVLVGRKGWIDSEIDFQVENDRALNGLVDVITDASDNELSWLYSNCLFTLFPALYEGWGLPVSESLWHGKPCISSNTSSMVEIAPELTIFASPYSVESWVDQIECLLFKPGMLDKQTEKVLREYVPTEWCNTAATIKDVIFEEYTK